MAGDKANRKEGGQQTIDWEAIKAAYAVGGDSLREVAERYGIALAQVQKHSASDGWGEARKAGEIISRAQSFGVPVGSYDQVEMDVQMLDDDLPY